MIHWTMETECVKVAVWEEEPGRVVDWTWGGLQRASPGHSLGLTSPKGLAVGVFPRQRPGQKAGER